MNKVVVALYENEANSIVINFACYICRIIDSPLTAIFLSDSALVNSKSVPVSDHLSTDEQRNAGSTKANNAAKVFVDTEYFRQVCKNHNLRYEIQQMQVGELIHNTRFFDLLIIPRTTGVDTRIPSEQMEAILSRTECPVLVAPIEFHEIQEIVHCYDGSKTSLIAIKEFTRIFNVLLGLRCILLKINSGDDTVKENEQEMRSWLKAHYSQADFNVVHGNRDKALSRFLEAKGNAIVVMGAYGRSQLSRLYMPSNAENLLRTVNLPVFIAHN